MTTEKCRDSQKHYVLVHGANHGAWCWYKIKPRLESAGHKVTVVDLAASGTNLKKIEDVDTMLQYSEPLLELLASLPSSEKVILVGHSLGGFNIAFAMEKVPEKVAIGVFLTAFVPDIEHRPSYVLEQYSDRTPASEWLDTEFAQCGNKNINVLWTQIPLQKALPTLFLRGSCIGKDFVEARVTVHGRLGSRKELFKTRIWISSTCFHCLH